MEKMHKFKPIQTLQLPKRYIINGPKVARRSGRLNPSQLPKSTSMRNLHFSPPPAFSTLLEISRNPLRPSIQHASGAVPSRNRVFNQKVPKNVSARSKRFNTENHESIYERHVESLKNYINDLTFKQDPLKKEETGGRQQLSDAGSAEERKQFLMGQVSFTNIDEQRVMTQKKYLERFEYLRKSVPRKVRESASGENGKGNESRVLECLRCIDRVYGLLREMEEVGYPLKTNRYIINYCSAGKLWLKRVFLHESDEKRDAFTIAVKYLVNHGAEDSKRGFAEFAGRTRGEELRVAQEDLEGLYLHLEHSLAQKKVNEVSSVAGYIEGRLREDGKVLSRSLRLTTAPQDKMKLTQDLEGIEEKFGAMRNITKISRRRYDELNRTYDKLQTLV